MTAFKGRSIGGDDVSDIWFEVPQSGNEQLLMAQVRRIEAASKKKDLH